jgi:hypothetical protein
MTLSTKGASRRMAQVTMSTKVGQHRNVSRPNPVAASTSMSTKPLNTPWPTNPAKLGSGLAKRAAIGSMPSSKAPAR